MIFIVEVSWLWKYLRLVWKRLYEYRFLPCFESKYNAWDTFNIYLLDINECTAGVSDCHSNATCTNTDGNHTCACNDGYTGDGYSCEG